MKMHRRAVTLVTLVAVAATALVSASASGASRSAGASGTPTSGCCNVKGHYTLTVFADQNWVQPAEKQLAAKFKQKTGITVTYDIVPDSTYQNLLTTKLNAGEEPGDIFMIQPPGGNNSGLQTTFQVERHAVDLSKQPWVKSEFAITRSLLTYKGKLYGQTIWDTISGSWVIAYNKADFAKAGITTLPTTFAEFTADCAKLKAAGFTPIFEPMDSASSWHPVLWFNENLTKATAQDPTLVTKLNTNKTTFAANKSMNDAMAQVNSLYQHGYFGPNALTNDYSNAVPAMAGGTYAMMVGNLTLPSQISAANATIPVSDYGFMPVPILDNQYINQNPGGPTKLVYKQGRHVAGALEYLDFLAEPQNLNYLIKNEPTVVTFPWKGVTAKWNAEQKAFETQYKPSPTPVGQVSINYDNPQWGNIGTDMIAMFTGQETPLQALQNIDMRRSQEAAAAKDPYWP